MRHKHIARRLLLEAQIDAVVAAIKNQPDPGQSATLNGQELTASDYRRSVDIAARMVVGRVRVEERDGVIEEGTVLPPEIAKLVE